MSGSLVRGGALIVVALLTIAALDGVRQHVIPGAGARADEAQPKRHYRHARRHDRQATLRKGSTPAEIARYFQLYGGYIDPTLNIQTPGGPFDSGFFFDSGIRPNGGSSPYMN
jgi:hypothetical protein